MPLLDGLVCCLKLNETTSVTAVDAHTGLHSGIQSAPITAVNSAGPVYSAYRSVSSNFFGIANHVDFQTGASKFSGTIKFFSGNWAGQNYPVFAGKYGSSDSDKEWLVFWHSAEARFYFQVFQGSNNYTVRTNTITPTNNVWYSLYWEYDSSKIEASRLMIRLNSDEYNGSAPATLNSGTANVTIGGNSAINLYHIGGLQQFAFWKGDNAIHGTGDKSQIQGNDPYESWTAGGGGSPATAYTFVGPSTGASGVPSTNFTLTPNGIASGVVITPAYSGVPGVFTPSTVSFSGSESQNFTFTPSGSGLTHITTTNNSGLTDPSGLNYTSTLPATLISVDNANFYFSPYNWHSGTDVRVSVNPGAYLSTVFDGTYCGLRVGNNHLVGVSAIKWPRIRWSVDNGPWQTQQLTSSVPVIQIASGVSDTNHTLKAYFLSSDAYTSRWDADMSIRVSGVILNGGKTISAPTIRNDQLIVYGDSITEGAWIEGPPTDLNNYSVYADATDSYINALAETLGCEYGSCAFGGQSWQSVFNSDIPDLPDAWDFYYSTNSRLSSGLLVPTPEYLICNMGANGGLSTSSDLTTWLGDVRIAAGPSCKIVVVVPFGGNGRTNIINGFNSYQSTPDPLCKLIDLGTMLGIGDTVSNPTFRTTDNLHLDPQGHAFIGAKLASAITDAFAASGVEEISYKTFLIGTGKGLVG